MHYCFNQLDYLCTSNGHRSWRTCRPPSASAVARNGARSERRHVRADRLAHRNPLHCHLHQPLLRPVIGDGAGRGVGACCSCATAASAAALVCPPLPCYTAEATGQDPSLAASRRAARHVHSAAICCYPARLRQPQPRGQRLLQAVLARACAETGQWPRARDAASRATELDEFRPDLYPLLARAEAALDHIDAALAALDRGQAVTPMGDERTRRAMADLR
jgi:hypothetical protein